MGQRPFPYFYGDQADAFSYYRIPRALITGREFRHVSTDAKLLYGLLLDRMGLSSGTAGSTARAGCLSTTPWRRSRRT